MSLEEAIAATKYLYNQKEARIGKKQSSSPHFDLLRVPLYCTTMAPSLGSSTSIFSTPATPTTPSPPASF